MSEPLWSPSPEWIRNTAIDRFRRERWPEAADSVELWRRSVEEPGRFWRSIWEWCGVVGRPGERDVETGSRFRDTTFLPDATLNVAENLLAPRPGADDTAIIALREAADPGAAPTEERWSWDRLRAETAALNRVFATLGLVPGDRVAAWMPHRAETVVAFLAAAAGGAVFTSTSADFGVDGVVDRFGQTEPRVLVAADSYRYGGRRFDLTDRLIEIARRLPSVELVIIVNGDDDGADESNDDGDTTHDGDAETGVAAVAAALDGPTVLSWSQAIEAGGPGPLRFEPVGTNHPLYILYSSGTTGKPKCIVHRSGGVLLKHLSEQQLHSDIRPGDRVFYFTTCGWMMWNWLVSALGSGATIVLYDGNPAHPGPGVLFEAAERHRMTLFGISAKFIDSVMKSGYRPAERVDLSALRTLCSTGSPLSPEGFAWIYDAVKSDLHVASISGGTDLCGCLVLGDPTRPVYSGEIQSPALGLSTSVFTADGGPAPVGEKGELVCTAPFPSMPLAFWGDDGDDRYQAAYFDRFDRADGSTVWAHGDYAAWTEHGGMIIFGRSDATLNASGVRIGTAEIYRIVEQLDEVQEAIAVAQDWDDDTRIVLFVRLSDGAELGDELVATIRSELRAKGSPRHVPAVVAAVDDIPRTRSGKIVELAVTDVVNGRPVTNTEALANPDALGQFASRPELA